MLLIAVEHPQEGCSVASGSISSWTGVLDGSLPEKIPYRRG
jgi:hypothetical protein